MGYDRKEEPTELDRAIKAWYSGEMGCKHFIENYWQDNWDDLIQHVQLSGFNLRNGKIPQALLDKEKEFIEGIIDYYLYTPISMEIGEQYYEKIEQQDIHASLIYWAQTGCTKPIKEIISQYMSGEIPEITKPPLSKGEPKKEKPKVPEWYVPYKKGQFLNKTIRGYYNQEISVEKFLEGFSGTWEDVLEGLVTVRKFESKEAIPGAFKARKEEFEKAVIKSFGKDYCEMTQIPVNGRYVHPTELDVEKTIKYLQKNNIELGKSIISQTLKKYLKGEIQLDQEEEKKKTVDESQVEEPQGDVQPINNGQVEGPQAEEPQEEASQADEVQIDETQTEEMQAEEPQADNVPPRAIDLGAMREQRGKCEQLSAKLQQMQGDLDIKKDRLRELQQILSQPNIEISKIQEFAGEMLTLAQQIEESQNAVDGLDIERLAGEQQLRKMKDAAIVEIEEI